MNKHDLIDAISGQLGSKKTATEAVRMALGLSRTSRKRCAHVSCGAGTDRRGGISSDEVMARS